MAQSAFSAGPVRISVLLYSGPGASPSATALARQSLTRLLHPSQYTISSISQTELLNEPWPMSTALLVFPGGQDELYGRELNGAGNAKIRRYVESGGRYLGLCAGGYYGSNRCEWKAGESSKETEEEDEWDVAGPRELAFFPGTCRGSVKNGYQYRSEHGARAVRIKPSSGLSTDNTQARPFRCYVNGGGVYVGADSEGCKARGVEPLALYDSEIDVDGGAAGAAAVYCKVGNGHAVLTGPHPEFDSNSLDRNAFPGYEKVVDQLKDDDEQRVAFLSALLSKMGLKLSEQSTLVPSLSKLHLSSSEGNAQELVKELRAIMVTVHGAGYVRDETDTFRLETSANTLEMDGQPSTQTELDAESEPSSGRTEDRPIPITSDGSRREVAKQHKVTEEMVERRKISPSPISGSFQDVIKRIVTYDTIPPSPDTTPNFNHTVYFASLSKYHSTSPREASAPRSFKGHPPPTPFGTPLLYGSVVTSTNSLLEKNPRLQRTLPTGFTFAASHQVAGRGRGNNAWVSPAGSLMFSVVVRHPAALMTLAPVVFLQYLAGMAVVEGTRGYDAARPEFANLPVRLKWPNDIYALEPTGPRDQKGKPRYVKVGGVLVNSSYSSADAEYVCVVGIGLNVLNAAPTTSLAAVLSTALPTGVQEEPTFGLEQLQASIIACFSRLYFQFKDAGFDRGLQQRYYRYWLHSGQVVELESEGGAKARIRGITTDWGLLEAEELPSAPGWFGEGAEGWSRGGTGPGAANGGRGRIVRLQSDGNSFDFMRGLVKRKI